MPQIELTYLTDWSDGDHLSIFQLKATPQLAWPVKRGLNLTSAHKKITD